MTQQGTSAPLGRLAVPDDTEARSVEIGSAPRTALPLPLRKPENGPKPENQIHPSGRLPKDGPFAGSSQVAKPENEPENNPGYLIESYTLKSGMYIETTMKPTMPPTTTIITGSRIEASCLTAAPTWSS
jgi:hypothetical protein